MTDTREADRPIPFTVILPVFDEEDAIPGLVERIGASLDELGQLGAEVIFVDDHSADRTPELLKDACTRGRNYRYLRLATNSGSHVAILAGLEHARGDCAVFLAADLQDPPELIPKMLDLWHQGHHVVWAVRDRRTGVSLVERIFNRVFYWLLIRVARVPIPPEGSDFALLDRKVIDALIRSAGACPSLGGQIARLGFSQAQITYTKEKRRTGRSKWTLTRKLRAIADAFVAFSYVPLRAMSYLGILFSVLGLAYAIVVIVITFLSETPIQGWASLMVVVLTIGGIQMTMLGVLGEYLWRTLEEARRRPRYFVEEEAGLNEDRAQQGDAQTDG